MGVIMAISDRTIARCAKSMVDTCNLKKGEGVIIRGGAHTQRLLEDIAIECYRKGTTPTIVVTSDRYLQKVFDVVPAKTLAVPHKQYVGMVKAADLIIAVEEMDDPGIAHSFPQEKLQARRKASVPVNDIVHHPKDGKKWLYAGWPTHGSAKRFGIPYSQLEETIIGGISTSPALLMRIGKKLAQKFEKATWAHAWDDKGTDFRVKIEGRRLNIDDGFTSDYDFSVGDRGANLPAGELFVSPIETVGEGTFFCPVTCDRDSGKIIKDVHLEFRDGELQLNKVRASKNGDIVVSGFRANERLDRRSGKTVRTRNVAELGIGFNPNIKKAIGYILADEKVNGTVHIAFGSNISYGGTSESILHWDFVSAPGINLDVERTDGKTVQVISKGKFL